MLFPVNRQHLCKHCGFPWDVHRASDQLCPATKNGNLWRGAWEQQGAPGTHYCPSGKVAIVP